RFRDPRARRVISRRPAVGRGGRAVRRPRSGPAVRGTPAVRSGRSLSPAGRVPPGSGTALGADGTQSQAGNGEVAQLALEDCRRHVYSFPQGVVRTTPITASASAGAASIP